MFSTFLLLFVTAATTAMPEPVPDPQHIQPGLNLPPNLSPGLDHPTALNHPELNQHPDFRPLPGLNHSPGVHFLPGINQPKSLNHLPDLNQAQVLSHLPGLNRYLPGLNQPQDLSNLPALNQQQDISQRPVFLQPQPGFNQLTRPVNLNNQALGFNQRPVFSQPPEFHQSGFRPQVQGGFVGQSQQLNPGFNQRYNLDGAAKVLSQNFQFTDLGYQYAYETENGIKAYQMSESQGPLTITRGSYSYTGDDGLVYTVNYIADQNGYRAEGSHLPTPPPIPEAILRSLEQNARDEAAGIFDDGSYHHHSNNRRPKLKDQYEESTFQEPIHQEGFMAPDQNLQHDEEAHHDTDALERQPMFKVEDKTIPTEMTEENMSSMNAIVVS